MWNISARAVFSLRYFTVLYSEYGYMARAIICITASSASWRSKPLESRNSIRPRRLAVERQMTSGPMTRGSWLVTLPRQMVTMSRRCDSRACSRLLSGSTPEADFSIVPSDRCLYFGILLMNTAAKVATISQTAKRPEALQEGVNAVKAPKC